MVPWTYAIDEPLDEPLELSVAISESERRQSVHAQTDYTHPLGEELWQLRKLLDVGLSSRLVQR